MPQLLQRGQLSISAGPPTTTCPWNHCPYVCCSVLPCAAVRNLLGRCLCGFLCIRVICMGFPWPPKLTLCAMGLVHTCLGPRGPPSVLGLVPTCLSPLSSPSMTWGSCTLVLAPAGPLHWGLVHTCSGPPGLVSASLACVCCSSACPASALGAGVDLFLLPVPALCTRFMCTYFVSLPALFVAGVICSLGCAGSVVWK